VKPLIVDTSIVTEYQLLVYNIEVLMVRMELYFMSQDNIKNNNNIMLNLMLPQFEKCSTNIKLFIKYYESVQFPTLKSLKFHVQFVQLPKEQHTSSIGLNFMK
jgi:hypothetical protein